MSQGIFSSPLHEGDYGPVRSPSTESCQHRAWIKIERGTKRRCLRCFAILDGSPSTEPAPTPESEAPKCECNWHLGMGPNLRCPVHQGRNYVRSVPVSIPPGDAERIVLTWLDAMHAKYPASEYGMVAVLVRSLSRQLEEARTENDRLRGIVKLYARHTEECLASNAQADFVCTCGLSGLLEVSG